MIKVTIYIERSGLEITKKKILLTKFNYCKNQLPSPKENLKKVNNIFFFLSNFDLETVILFLVQFQGKFLIQKIKNY